MSDASATTETRRYPPPGLLVCAAATIAILGLAFYGPPSENAPVRYFDSDTAIAVTLAPRNSSATAPPQQSDAADPDVSAIRQELKNFRHTGDARHLRYAKHRLHERLAERAGSPEAGVLEARILQAEHLFDAAAKRLDAIVSAWPTHLEARLLLADSLRRAGRIGRAREACVQMTFVGAADLARLCAIQVLQVVGDRERAYAAALGASGVDRHPELERWSLEIRADAARGVGRFDEAKALYEQAFAIPSPPLATRLAYADTLLATGEYAAARSLLQQHRQTLAAHVRYAVACKNLGLVVDRETRDALAARFTSESPAAGRELEFRDRAVYELWYRGDAARAVDFALANWHQQKGAEDLELLRAAAVAAGDAVVLAELHAWQSHARGEPAS